MRHTMSDLIVVGDRVLIEPLGGEQLTESGLVLPATVTEKDKVQGGRIIRVGPGYLTANPEYSESEPWKKPHESVRYLPLQADVGDFAYFLKRDAVEMQYKGHDFLVVRHGAILALVRPDSSDILDKIEEMLR
jgi:chaperonin GroES